ncbi:hypothetical protein [Lonsdalea quercina]|uniref:hypothetical protein n=1 Tax=Lonsdalea quercina TaxID=71657 RepID=UPI003976DD41
MSNGSIEESSKKEKKQAVKLNEHRESLKKNPNAYTVDLERKWETLVRILKASRYHKMDLKNPECVDLARDITMAIFNAQGCKPYFHIDSDLPFCWNVPSKWYKNYIYYEWGHMNSIHNHANKAKIIKNLCLQSQRCNQHIQSALDIEELKKYGGKLEEVINKNQASFAALHASDEWKALEDRLIPFRSRGFKED